MKLELARQNSEKSKRSHQGSTMGPRSDDQLNHSQAEGTTPVERPHKRIDLNESELHQYSQHQYPNTTRSLANHPAPFSPQQTADLNKISQQ